MKKEVIYTSEYLRTSAETQGVALALFRALDELGVEHRELMHTRDYWCRDYMPVALPQAGEYAGYIYRPDYLHDYKSKRRFITPQTEACEGLAFKRLTPMDIVMDGGNVVRCDSKILMTDKVLMENATWPVGKLLEQLEQVLEGEVILLPWDMKDPCGHTDGMVADLGGGSVLLNVCWRERNKAFHKRLLKLLEPHFQVVELSYNCPPNPNDWCYLNYLRVPGGILLPTLSEQADCPSDLAALATFHQLFPRLKIIPVYTLPLVKQGGALHCVTWEGRS